MADANGGRVTEKLIEVTWGDAWGTNRWYDETSMPDAKPVMCVSVGFLIKESKAGLTMAATKADNGDYTGVSFRPRGMIKKIRRLK